MATVGVINYDFTANTDDLKKKLESADKDVDKKASEIGSKFGKIGELAKVGLAAAGASLVAFGAGAVNAFADYEQLAGGIETLFKGSANTMFKFADEAYKTAGMSANKYMETATSFSASLLNGLGGDTEKAAQYANKAIVAMSDNANKMGTSMEAIQFAYQGFAKQNYTMLDNLKLGYGGTASEMARLVNESGVMGKSFKATVKNINEVSFDKIIEAIEKTQDRLGITGTTAKEASSTISGSFNSMTAAWDNFLVSMTDGEGDSMEFAFKDLYESAKTWLNNIIPVVEDVFYNIIGMIGDLAGRALSKFREKFGGWAPVIESVTVAVAAAVAVWKTWTGAIALWKTAKAAALAVQLAFNAAMAASPIGLIVTAIAAVVAGLIYFFTQTELGKQVFSELMKFFGMLFDEIGKFFVGIGQFFVGLWNGIVGVISPIVGFFAGIFNTIWQIVSGVVIAVVAIFAGLIQVIMSVVVPIVAWIYNTIIAPVVNFFAGMWSGIIDGVSGFVQGVMNVLGVIGGWVNDNIIQPIAKFFGGLWNGVMAGVNGLVSGFKTVFGTIGGIIKAPINGIIDLINGVIGGINKLKVPDWVPVLGGSSPNIPRIPKLATGGIVGPEGGNVIVAGDGGEDEWVVPESKMASLMRQIGDRGGSGGDTININVSGVFATNPAEQRRVAEQIAEQLELIKKRRMEV